MFGEPWLNTAYTQLSFECDLCNDQLASWNICDKEKQNFLTKFYTSHHLVIILWLSVLWSAAHFQHFHSTLKKRKQNSLNIDWRMDLVLRGEGRKRRKKRDREDIKIMFRKYKCWLGPLHVKNCCVAWSLWGALGSRTRIYPWMHELAFRSI